LYGFLGSNASNSSSGDSGDDERMVGDNEKIMSDKKMVNNDEDNEGTVNDIGEKNQLTRG
jgi:hypothetical protein